MKFSRAFGVPKPILMTLKVGADLVAGQPGIWLSTASGNVTDPASVTDLTDALGVTTAASGTYSTTQGDAEATAQLVVDPNAIFESRVVPSATAGTAFADADGYFLTETTGSATGALVSDATVGGSNDDCNDGWIVCLSGANAGQTRVITDMAANTSVTVTVPFLNDIAVGDTFLISQYNVGVLAVQMTTDFTQANGTVAGGTGGEAAVVNIYHDDVHEGATKAAPHLYIELVLTNHAFKTHSLGV